MVSVTFGCKELHYRSGVQWQARKAAWLRIAEDPSLAAL